MGPIHKQFLLYSVIALTLALSFWGFIAAGLILMYHKYIWISLLSFVLGVICRVITLRLARRLAGMLPFLHTEELLRQVNVLSPNTQHVVDVSGHTVGVTETEEEDGTSTTYVSEDEKKEKEGYKVGE